MGAGLKPSQLNSFAAMAHMEKATKQAHVAVLLSMAILSDEAGELHIAHSALGKRVGLSPGQARRVVYELADLGYLSMVETRQPKGGQGANRYKLWLPEPAAGARQRSGGVRTGATHYHYTKSEELKPSLARLKLQA